jgi:hypothetical protein
MKRLINLIKIFLIPIKHKEIYHLHIVDNYQINHLVIKINILT